LYIAEKIKEKIGKEELTKVLEELVISIYGRDIEYKISDDSFPYTEPSLQAEVKFN